MRSLVAFGCGLVFALGLGLGQMTRPARVVAFLDVAGRWDPTLAFVMLGAVAVTFVVFPRIIASRTSLVLPTRRDVDLPLLLGAGTFGVGWGLAGYCPGPALVSLATGAPAAFVYVLAMLVGLRVGGRLERSLAGAPPHASVAARDPEPAGALTPSPRLPAATD